MFERWRRTTETSAKAARPAARSERDSPVVVNIERKELFECGFEFCGSPIAAAFARSGVSVVLDDQRDWPEDSSFRDDGLTQCLWVDNDYIIEVIGHDVEFELADGSRNVMSALGWDLLMALRKKFHDPDDPERNWHVAGIDGGFDYILCRPDQFGSLPDGPRLDYESPLDLTGAYEIRRGAIA